MVQSILNTNVNYPEIKKLDPEDKDYDASMYEINILGLDITIAIGQAKYSFIDNNIVYYPIYLVDDEKVTSQIGVYEILADQLPNIIDDDGDVDLDKVDNPLIYSFVTKNTIQSTPSKTTNSAKPDIKKENVDEDSEETDSDEEGSDEDSDETDSDEEGSDEKDSQKNDGSNNKQLEPLPKQSAETSESEMKNYKKQNSNPWIQDFMKSNEYELLDNEGGGDCLFAVIKEAFNSIDKDMTVLELRNKLANEVNSELFENYKELYNANIHQVQSNETEMKELNKLNNELRDRLKNSKERKEQEKIVEHAKDVAAKYKKLKSEMKISKSLLSDFKFMRKVNSVEDLKNTIKTCDFWADTWAISTLERILNIKLIVFSSESWNEGDNDNVLQCGQLNDIVLEEKGIFEPEYYILLDYTGNHYKLITYKYHKIFNFSEIPYSVKLDIAKNCMQGTSGPYKIIPQMSQFNSSLGVEEPIDLDVNVLKEQSNPLYSSDIVFQYYTKSNNKPMPGKGNGEKIPIDKIKDFSQLHEISEWRRKLSNEYTSPFELDGHKWKTVEHYYQANKFKNTNKEFYLLFSLDSESKISEDVELAKSAGSKSGKHKTNLLRNKDIKIDPDFYSGSNESILENAIHAKFTQDKTDLKKMLLLTKPAKLVEYKRGSEPTLSNALMLVRNRLQNE